ncbi:MAG: carbohydrate ABC transporter permease [Deltaproteobacteria bacterium]|jgi:multiple sugar transport system permease protein|nr:carbohydrate ABC transporter permease [Deltaproteobacteria bacterium]MBT6501918.1 carbohydrate ABC transporter permease [Deltaproteobacteria bacterium]MBT7711336.1 carbohydrate ABC transporter permease [Deltaproteobacteria bacterium]
MEKFTAIQTINRILFYAVLISIVTVFFFPFIWVVFTSLQDAVTASSVPPDLTATPTLDNFRLVFEEGEFLTCLLNSTIVVFFTLAANLIISLPAAYVIARNRQNWMMFLILFLQMAPWICMLLPWYIIFKKVGLYDTYIGLVLSNLTFMIPFTIWLMLGFFEDVPVEVEEAAWLDGCSHLGTFVRIVIPLVKGGIITISTLGFMLCWNIFIFPLVLSGYETKTLPVFVFGFMADNQLDFGPLAAASLLTMAPVILFVLINQKYFKQGIAFGGGK